MIQDFGTPELMTRFKMKFEKDKSEIGKKIHAEWVNNKIKILEAFSPECDNVQRNKKSLFLMDPETSWSIKMALQKDNFSLSELTNVLNSLASKIELLQNKKTQNMIKDYLIQRIMIMKL